VATFWKWLGPLALLAVLVAGDQIRINRPGHKYRLTVEVETPAGARSASGVLAVTPDRGYNNRGRTRTSGDAIFVDLIYPTSPNTHPPYRQSPSFVWMQISGQSASGLTRVIQRRAQQRLTYAGHACDPKAEVQGPNRLWLKCSVRLVSPAGDTTTQRLFGTIVERGGRFKFVSYANQF
jgi:hypothetical protein